VLSSALAISLAMSAVFVALNTIHSANRSAQTQIASDALMHSQRIGKAAPNAVQGSAEGFRQLEESRKELNKRHQADDAAAVITKAATSASQVRHGAPVVAAARKQWGATDKAAGTILTA
jgi:twitching motility protein PilJ